MHVRAYNYWVSLLDGRDFPSIEDLEPGDVQDFAAHSVLLDFTCGGDNPAIPYVGAAIRDECALDDDMRTIADVPSRSLLSRLTDHYMQIIANRAPVGFEAEFENQRGDTICYRGILMPFSSDGDTIDFIYGVINWKRVDEPARSSEPVEHDRRALTDAEPLEVPMRRAALELEDRAARTDRRCRREIEPEADDAATSRVRDAARATSRGKMARSDDEDGRSRARARRGCRACRPPVGRTRDRRVGQGGRRPHPHLALQGAVASL